MVLPRSLARDRANPTIADVLLHDLTQPLSPEVRTMLARDLARGNRTGRCSLSRAHAFTH